MINKHLLQLNDVFKLKSTFETHSFVFKFPIISTRAKDGPLLILARCKACPLKEVIVLGEKVNLPLNGKYELQISIVIHLRKAYLMDNKLIFSCRSDPPF